MSSPISQAYESAVSNAIWNWWKDIEVFGNRNSNGNDNSPSHKVSKSSTNISGSFTVIDPFCTVDAAAGLKGEDADVQVDNHVLSGCWRRGRRHGRGSLSGPALESSGIALIVGRYRDGWLQGTGKVFLDNDVVLEGHFRDGKLVGLVCGVDTRRAGRLCFVGHFVDGRAEGPVWRQLEGDGFLYGEIDARGRFSGEDVVFLYPDAETALRGTFESDRMVEGRECRVVSCRPNNEKSGVMELDFKEDPQKKVFRYWPSSLYEIACPPMQEDPFERRWVEVRRSAIEGAGEGLFARRRIPEGATVAFYNGIRVRPGEEPQFRSRDYEIYVDWSHGLGVQSQHSDYLDLPEEYTSVDRYRASLGHKVNHSFAPSCKWDTAVHPTFGRIPRIVTLRTIEAGEELTCHYMIDMEEASVSNNLGWYVAKWQQQSSTTSLLNEDNNMMGGLRIIMI